MSQAPLDPEAIRIGETIRALREANGWKLGQFATAVGKSHSYISNIEAGRKMPPRALCREIADALNVPLAAIVSTRYVETRASA